MRLGSTLLALTLSAMMGSASQAQFDKPVEKDAATPKVKTGVKPQPAKKPAAKTQKRQVLTGKMIRQQQAQAEAAARNAFVFPPASADPLGLAPQGNVVIGVNGMPLGIVAGGAYVDPRFANNLSQAAKTGNFTGVIPSRGPGATAKGGLSGTSDKQLIHGSDGDGNGELSPQVGDISHPRVDKVKGGSYVPGYGVPVRKGELVYRGNYLPGQGVMGESTDATQSGTYRPGYGVVGGNSATSFGANTGPSYYGGSSLLNNNYGGNGNAGFYGGSSLLNNNYGGNGNAGFYGGSSLLNNNYGGNGNAGFYGGSGLLNNNYGGNGNAAFYGGAGLLNNNYGGNGNAGFYGGTGLLPGLGGGATSSVYGGGALPGGFSGHAK